MNKVYIVTLDDVSQRRATVMAVTETTIEAYCRMRVHAQNYAVVSDENLVPVVGERVWIAQSIIASGERTITARQ